MRQMPHQRELSSFKVRPIFNPSTSLASPRPKTGQSALLQSWPTAALRVTSK